MLNPELGQNLFYAVYFLILHNVTAIIYFTGLLVSTVFSLYRPSRIATLLMLGFASLLFSFEYKKHIVEALREQTVNSVITTQPHYKLEKLITVSISKLIPLVLNLIGAFSLLLAAVLKMRDFKKGKS